MAEAEVTFIEGLESFGPALAIVDREGGHVSYDALLARAGQFTETLGPARRLVFLEAANTVDAIAAYVACLKAHHPLYLFGSNDHQKLGGLIDRYSPNAVIKAEATGSEVTWLHRDSLDLHADLSVLLSTSGSTGSPKLVKLSRRNLDSNARAISTYLGLNDSERAITSLPFNYSYGMSVVNSHLACGGALVLTDSSVTDTAFWKSFTSAGATSFAGVPYTFESLHQSRFELGNLKTLRYATQAGGRLDPALVTHFARLAAAQGWKLFVMYGQTEAAPRMAYLPPERAEEYPRCIGIPAPGGRIDLLDDKGREITEVDTPGELAYSGPNVMMGYAENVADLATDQTPARLMTGDIASRNSAGLFYITGRAARFVKLYGLRINLDDLEATLQAELPGARCAGDDQGIVIAVPAGLYEKGVQAASQMATSASLPEFVFRVVAMPEMPRLATGKIDYARILAPVAGPDRTHSPEVQRVGPLGAVRLILSRRFANQFALEFADIVGARRRDWKSVGHIYETLLATPDVRDSDTFKSLAGDSLSYVQVAVALTDYLGALPVNWPERTVRDLELAGMEKHGSLV